MVIKTSAERASRSRQTQGLTGEGGASQVHQFQAIYLVRSAETGGTAFVAAGGTGLGERGAVSYSEVSGIVTVYLLSQRLKAPCTPVDGRPLSYRTQLICTGNNSPAVSVKENTSLYRPSRHPWALTGA